MLFTSRGCCSVLCQVAWEKPRKTAVAAVGTTRPCWLVHMVEREGQQQQADVGRGSNEKAIFPVFRNLSKVQP